MPEENTLENQAPIDPELSEAEAGELSDAELDAQAGGFSSPFQSGAVSVPPPSFNGHGGIFHDGGEQPRKEESPANSKNGTKLTNFSLP